MDILYGLEDMVLMDLADGKSLYLTVKDLNLLIGNNSNVLFLKRIRRRLCRRTIVKNLFYKAFSQSADYQTKEKFMKHNNLNKRVQFEDIDITRNQISLSIWFKQDNYESFYNISTRSLTPFGRLTIESYMELLTKQFANLEVVSFDISEVTIDLEDEGWFKLKINLFSQEE